MDLGKSNLLGRFKYFFIIYGVIIAIVLLALFTDVFKTKEAGAMPSICLAAHDFESCVSANSTTAAPFVQSVCLL